MRGQRSPIASVGMRADLHHGSTQVAVYVENTQTVSKLKKNLIFARFIYFYGHLSIYRQKYVKDQAWNK